MVQDGGPEVWRGLLQATIGSWTGALAQIAGGGGIVSWTHVQLQSRRTIDNIRRIAAIEAVVIDQ